MAATTDTSNTVTDPHTLLGVSRAVIERLSPQASQLGPYATRLIEQLRLLFINSQQGLFVFGYPDEITRVQANLYARAALKRALQEIFEAEVRIELVIFNPEQDSLAPLIAEFAGQGDAANQEETIPPQKSASSTSEMSSAELPDAEPHLNQIQLGLVQNNLRSVFTSPKRVVVVPGYLLRWIPYLGPLRTSIVVACFQAFYLSKRTTAKANLVFEAPGPFLAAVAGIAESSLWRHLDDPELGWFIKKVPYKPGEKQWVRDERAGQTKKKPTRFLFRSTSPLTPGDAQALTAYLLDLNIQENPVGVLTELVRGDYRVEPRDIFPFPAPPPPQDWQQGDPRACLIHDLIFSAIGVETKMASKELTGLVDELVERLLPFNDQVHLSWYFLLHWLPLLGHGPGWATILLRDRCFYNRQTGELRDTVSVRGGYQELANALGLQRVKTVREWLPAPHIQKAAAKSADLSSWDILTQISQSKRSFVKEYAAKFVQIIEANADGRGQVSAFKAQVKLFDPLTPAHEAIYNALFPLARCYFSLSQEQKTAFLHRYDEALGMDANALEKFLLESSRVVAEVYQRYALPAQPGAFWLLDDIALADFLGAIERITSDESGAIRSFNPLDPGAFERQPPANPGADGSITLPVLGAFERFSILLLGAFERLTHADPGAFERLGLVFWAQMRGLKYLVLNNSLCETLKDYFQNTDLINPNTNTSTTTSVDPNDDLDNSAGDVEVDSFPVIKKWDLNKLLDNFSPHVKKGLLERGVTVEAVLSGLFYIASSKGESLGLGYVVEKLKAHPRDGQGGIYHRLAEDEPEEIVARLHSYVEYRSFQSRDWRVAMGTPTTEKILELLEHLGLDSSKFGSQSY